MHQNNSVMSLVGPLLVLAVSALGLGCRPCAEAPEVAIPPMDPYLAIWNDGNLNVVDELYAPDFVWHVVDIDEDVVGTADCVSFGGIRQSTELGDR